MNCPKKKFTAEEDAMLLKLVKKYGACKWDNIALSMPGRKGRQCRDRYMNYLNPTVKNDEWTLEEDSMLIEKVKEFGPKWAKISKFFQGRTGPALKNRWNYRLSRIDNQTQNITKCQEAEPVVHHCHKSEFKAELGMSNIIKADMYSASVSINLPHNVDISSSPNFIHEPIAQPEEMLHISSKLELMDDIKPKAQQNCTKPVMKDNIIDEIFGNLSHEDQLGLLYDCYDIDFGSDTPTFIF